MRTRSSYRLLLTWRVVLRHRKGLGPKGIKLRRKQFRLAGAPNGVEVPAPPVMLFAKLGSAVIALLGGAFPLRQHFTIENQLKALDRGHIIVGLHR